jgi:hypothetical protein
MGAEFVIHSSGDRAMIAGYMASEPFDDAIGEFEWNMPTRTSATAARSSRLSKRAGSKP